MLCVGGESVPDPLRISRKHAELFLHQDGDSASLRVADLKSVNGTYVM